MWPSAQQARTRAPPPLLHWPLRPSVLPLQAWSSRTQRPHAPCKAPSWASSSACRGSAHCWAPAWWHSCHCQGAGCTAPGTKVSVGASPGVGHEWREAWKGGDCPVLRAPAEWSHRLPSESGVQAKAGQSPTAWPPQLSQKKCGTQWASKAPSCFWNSVILAEGVPSPCGICVLSPLKDQLANTESERDSGQPGAGWHLLSVLRPRLPATLLQRPAPREPHPDHDVPSSLREHQQLPDGPVLLPAGRHPGCHSPPVHVDRWSL